MSMLDFYFVFVVAFLGAYAGKENTTKLYRRLGIPTLIILYVFYYTNCLISVLVGLFVSIVLSMGYGENSVLKKIFSRDFYIRSVVALLLSLSFLPLVLFCAVYYKLYIVLSIYLVFGWAVFGGDEVIKDEGKIHGLLIEDLILYGILGLYCTLLLTNYIKL